MIPIIYEGTETSFTTNGICRLPDTISCKVTQSSAIYECEFKYPITGLHYAQIQEGRIVAVIHDDKKDVQPFDIYGRSAPMNGVVTFYARHISYRLGKIALNPFTAQSVAEAMAQFPAKAMCDCPFTFRTDKTTVANFTVAYPKTIKSVLSGSAGSLLDTFGTGEYEFDKFAVKLYAHKGIDSGVEIRYGKNLTDITQDYDAGSVVNCYAPYWYDSETGDLVVAGLVPDRSAAEAKIEPFDMSNDYTSKPTPETLRAAALSRYQTNDPASPKETIDVDFVALWQTAEYDNVAPLQRLSLYDTVSVIYKQMGINAVKFKVVKVVYNVLLERFDTMELGNARRTYSQAITSSINTSIENLVGKVDNLPTKGFLDEALQHATDLISGGLGGYIVTNSDADGYPQEILIMDTPDIKTSVNVIRINRNGIGFSSTGYNGPFTSAWTIDGHFVADFIDTGTLNANLLTAGIISDQKGKNYWNLETGEISISAEGEVTREDLERVENNAKAYADDIETELSDQIDAANAAVEEVTNALSSNIQVTDSSINSIASRVTTVESSMIDESGVRQLITSETETRFATLEQNSEGFAAEISTTNERLSDLSGSTQEAFNRMETYLRYSTDSEGHGVVSLGDSDNPIHLEARADRVAFVQNGTDVAYFSDNKLYVTDAEILGSLRIGDYEWIRRSNGHLTLRAVN